MSHNELDGKDKRYTLIPLPGKRNPKVEKQIDEAWQEVVQKGFDLKLCSWVEILSIPLSDLPR